MIALRDGVWQSGPYEAVSSRQGTIRESEQIAFAKAPACRVHNTALDTHFEVAGQPAFKRLIGIGSVKDERGKTVAYPLTPLEDINGLDEKETTAVGRWLVKTTVISAHHQTAWEMAGAHVWGARDGVGFPECVYADLFAGRTPEGMNAWIVLADQNADADSRQIQQQRLAENQQPPTRIVVGTTGGVAGCSSTWGLGIRHGENGRVLHVQVMWQPGAIVVHPDEETGLAVRVWPNPQVGIRLAEMPMLDGARLDEFRATFAAGGGNLDAAPVGTPILAAGAPFMYAANSEGPLRMGYMKGTDEARVNQIRTFLQQRGF